MVVDEMVYETIEKIQSHLITNHLINHLTQFDIFFILMVGG